MLELEHEFICEPRAELEQPPNIVGPIRDFIRKIQLADQNSLRGCRCQRTDRCQI
jgi:hypothetical protein